MRALSRWPSTAAIRYGALIAGMLLGNIGVWIHRVSQIWLAMSLSATPGKSLSYVIIAQTVPSVLLAIVGGVLADKVRKGRLIIFSQGFQLALTLILGVLTLSNHITSFHIIIIALLFGATIALETPARQTILSEFLPEDRVKQAVAINTTIYSVSRVVGPAIAGALIATFGVGTSFLLNIISYLSLIGAVYYSGALSHKTFNYPAFHVGSETVAFLKRQHALLIILLAFSVMSCFGFNFQMTIGLIAKLEFSNDASLYGLLSSLLAVGALASSLITLKYNVVSAPIALISVIIFGATLLISGNISSHSFFAGSLVAVGFFATVAYTLLSTYIQTSSPQHIRGRIVSLSNALNTGSVPLGVIALGYFSDYYGAQYTFIFGGAIVAIFAALLLLPWSLWSERISGAALEPNQTSDKVKNSE